MNLFEIIGYPLFIVAALEVLLGVVLLRHNPHDSRVNRSVAAFSFFTAAFALNTGLMYVLASFGRDITTLARANWVGWLMIPAALQFIFYMRDENSRAARIVAYLLYPFWTIVLCVSVSTPLIESGHYTLIPYIDRSGPLAKPLRAFGIIQLAWVIYELFRLRVRSSGLKREQLNYFTIGLLIFTIGGTLVSGVLQLFGGFGLEPGLGSYFSLPWVALAAYAMTRHRLFDIWHVISQFVSLLLLWALVSSVQIGLFTLLHPALGNALAILLSLSSTGLLFFGTPVGLKAHQWITHAILRNKYDYQDVLRESIQAIATKLELDELLEFIIASIRKNLEVESVCFFLKTTDGKYLLRQGFDVDERISQTWPLTDTMIQWLKQRERVVIREEYEQEAESREKGSAFIGQYLKATDTAAVIPLLHKGRLLGVLTLGRKKNKEPFGPIDIDLLESLAIQASVAIENALLYDRMEEKVRERTRELEQARKAAETANKAKSEFLSNISHELRTPLNSIIGFSEIMRDGTTGPLTPDQQTYLNDIWESGKHLLRIINNVLDLSKMEAGMMHLELDEFYLKELLEGSLSLFREKAQRQRITLSAEISDDIDMVVADKTKIKQVTLNLLANALKFTPENGSVRLVAQQVRGIANRDRTSDCGGARGPGFDADFIEISVIDTGIGISSEECAKLFQPFVQLDNTLTRKYEGTGLGLHLSRKIAELHGGRIWVESAVGKGSRFSFVVPLVARSGLS